MLKKRIIACLDVKNGRTVKGVNFVDLIDAGNPVELAKQYVRQGVDELVFLDISATEEQRKTTVNLVQEVAKEVSIPFTVGGGIASVKQARAILLAGAEKIAVNSAAIRNPQLIQHLANEFGSQAVVVAIDAKQCSKSWQVFISGGKQATEIDVIEWAKQAKQLGAGEILLTSMDADGTKAGFAIDLVQAVCKAVNIPVIASGGAGNSTHFAEVFLHTKVSAALAASIFHFGEITIPQLKQNLQQQSILVR